MLHEEIIIAGFGGQGVLSSGMIIAYAGMMEGRMVSWLPTYGPEKRGGKVQSGVKVTEGLVGSPVIDVATSMVIMNEMSLIKYAPMLKPGGRLLLDTAMVGATTDRDDLEVHDIPAMRLASDLGNKSFAGIVLLGGLVAATGVVGRDSFKEGLRHVLPEKKHYLIDDEMKAFDLGHAAVANPSPAAS